MADPHNGVDVPAGVEIGFKLHPHRIGCSDEIIEDAIGHLLMGDGAISVAVDVELDRLEFHHPWTRLVEQPQHRKVGVAGKRTFAGEFRQLNRHLIGPSGPGVVEADQLSLGNRPIAIERCLSLLIS